MANSVADLLTRNLQSVFGERDPARRRAAIAQIWTEDGLFVDPHGRTVGHDGLDAAVAQLHTLFPGFVFAAVGEPQTFFEVGRLAWAHGPAGAPPSATGVDIVTVRDGRIATLYTFIDPPAASG